MESEQLYLMIQQFAEDSAKIEIVKNILMSDVISDFAKLEALYAVFGIKKADIPCTQRIPCL